MPSWAVECRDVSTQITDTTASCQFSSNDKERRAGKKAEEVLKGWLRTKCRDCAKTAERQHPVRGSTSRAARNVCKPGARTEHLQGLTYLANHCAPPDSKQIPGMFTMNANGLPVG